MNSEGVNDDNVEGAVKLMEKVGHLLDAKLKLIIERKEASTEATPLKPVELETAD